MNKALMEARKKFRGQKGKISTGYKDEQWPEGKYTCVVTQSEVKDVTMREETFPAHVMRVKVVLGDMKGKSKSLFPNNLTDESGLVGSARNVMNILGEVVPGKSIGDEFEIDFQDYLATCEDLIPQCLDELVEVTLKNGRKTREDGTPYQNVYINRGLGDDAKGVLDGESKSSEELFGDDDLDMGIKKKATKKKATKKKVAKKKKKASRKK